MEGADTLYSTRETLTSPVKNFLLQQHHNQSEANLSDASDCEKEENQNLRWLLSKTSEKAKSYLSETFEKLKNKYEEQKSRVFKNDKQSKKVEVSPKKKKNGGESRIFVTRTSKEFAQIKIEENLNKSSSVFMSPVVGACIVALPYALKQSGLVLGVLLIFFVCLALDYSEYLLIQCSISSEQKHIPTLTRNLFGRLGYIVYFSIPYIFQFSILLAYFVILGDTSTKCLNSLFQIIHPEAIDFVPRRIALSLMLVFVIPVSLTRNQNRISHFSILSLAIASLLMVLVVIRLFTLNEQIPRVSEIYHPFKYLGTNIIQSLAVVIFAMSCQHPNRLAYMRVYATREQNIDRPADVVTAYTLLLSIVVASGGYTTLNAFTQGNILENYCEEDLLASITRVAFTVFMICLFPIECQNVRNLTEELVLVHKRFKRAFDVGLTLLILLPVFVVSLFVDCLPLVLETTSVLMAMPMVFILPPVLFIRQFPGRLLSPEKLPCLMFLCLGVALSASGLAVTVFSSHHCIHSTSLFPYCNGSNDLVAPLITLMSLNASSSLINDDNFIAQNNINMSQLERYGFENLTDIVNAYFA